MRAPRGKLKDLAAAHIRLQIANGELHPGERIDQDAVAEEVGISRLPVREALIQLESEGLVRVIPRRGVVVEALTPEDIRDTYRMYGFASGIAAERAARHATDDDLRVLGDLLGKMDQTSDRAELEQLNDQLHARINQLGMTARLRSILRALAPSLYSGFFYGDQEWVHRARQEHDEIVSALLRRDPTAARAAMERHLGAIGEHAVEELLKRGFWATPDGG
ncbi:MAG TPA: GntR family transcriptional regulator [Euzebya sp.]|nr:GntR family transcriptional regulator [Euzebya sp.]